MDPSDAPRLYILTGPACVGTTPLIHALRDQYKDWMLQIPRIVLYNSRPRRPLENDGVDYHFRSRRELKMMIHDPRMILLDVRGDLQALDVDAIKDGLQNHALLFEGNPLIAEMLPQVKRLEAIPLRSVFISPLSKDEIRDIRNMKRPEDVVAEVMRAKLLRRTHQQKENLALPDLETIERQAQSAWAEIKMAPMFDAVIVNHDGEDSDHWDAFPILIGEARKTRNAVYAFFKEGTSSVAEKWTHQLFKSRRKN